MTRRAPVSQTPPTAAPRRASRLEIGIRFAMLLICVTAMIMTGRMLWKGNPGPIRVAVVRFVNDTGKPDLDGFASGLTDLIGKDLSSTNTQGRITVVGDAGTLPQPNAQYIVQGKIQRDVSRIRVVANLIRLPEQTSVSEWRHEWDANALLPSQDALAREIVARFAASLLSS